MLTPVVTEVWSAGELVSAQMDADKPRGKTMGEPTHMHYERANKALERHTTRTMGQLIAAGSSWRAVNDLVRTGEVVIIGSTPCAKLVFALAGASA